MRGGGRASLLHQAVCAAVAYRWAKKLDVTASLLDVAGALVDLLGVGRLSPRDLGPEPYMAVLGGCGPSHLRFLGGFCTATRAALEAQQAMDKDPSGLQAEASPMVIDSAVGHVLLHTLRRAQENWVARTLVLRMRVGSDCSFAIRLCIWAAHVPARGACLYGCAADVAPR